MLLSFSVDLLTLFYSSLALPILLLLRFLNLISIQIKRYNVKINHLEKIYKFIV